MSNHPSLHSLRTTFVGLRALLLSAGTALVLPAAAFAQGALTPPGAPAPTMKSLTELDSSLSALAAKADTRTAVEDLPGDASNIRIISTPGSYYLRGNLTGALTKSGIRITANNVVLDLNGFALTGGAGSATGVIVNAGVRQVVIRNGTIATWAQGIGGGSDIRVSEVQVRGCTSAGIYIPGQGIVHHAQVADCGVVGINAGLVTDSTVTNIGATAAGADGIIASNVHHCRVDGVTTVTGAAAGISASLVKNSNVANVSGSTQSRGIVANAIHDCTVLTVSGTSTAAAWGLYCVGAVSGCDVRSVTASGNSATGVYGEGVANCRIETVTGPNASGLSGCDTAENVTVSGVEGSSTTATGINSTVARGCRVDSITAATSCTGISGEMIQTCRVVGLTAQTAVVGINTGTLTGSVADSTVYNLMGGTTATASAAGGIISPTVTNCTVRSLNLNASSNGNGISAATVHQSTVRFISANVASDLYGIEASNVSGCTVTNVTNSIAAGLGSAIGITGNSVGGSGRTALIEKNTITACTTGAIFLTGVARIVGNVCEDNGEYGIYAPGMCTITDNLTQGHTVHGYRISGASFVARNVSFGDTTAFSLNASALAGAVVAAGGVTSDANVNVDH